MTLFPFLIVIVSYIFWQTYGLLQLMGAKEKSDKHTATVSIIFFLFYPSIVFRLAESVNCVDVDGVKRLYGDLEEECYVGQHRLLTIFVSGPGLLLWAFGIPLFFLWRLRRRRYELHQVWLAGDHISYDAEVKRFRMQLGFLTSGYIDKFYYWEIVLLYRKTGLVLLVTFLAPISGGCQSLSFICVLIFFYITQQLVNPYYDARLNNLERVSLVVLILTIYCGIFF